jgi:hypothetical protein
MTRNMADGLEAAQREYYNARYGSAARVTADACAADANGLAACELRTAVLLFQIKAPLGPEDDKEKAWKNCARAQTCCRRSTSRWRIAGTVVIQRRAARSPHHQ